MVAEFIEGIARHGKRGFVYVGVGILQTLLGFYLALHAPQALTGFAAIVAAVDFHLYGGGALKAWADRGNGNGAPTPTTSA